MCLHIMRLRPAPTLPETTPAANAAAAAASLIMSSETCIILRKELIHLGCIIPPHFILTDIASVTAFQAAITSTSQQSQNSMIATLFDTVTISIYFNAATMLLLRPQLYLTSCLPIDHPVLLSNPDNITHLLSTLSSSITAARCITYINSWILHHTAESTNPTPLRHKIWHEHLFSSFPLFEAALVLWFATCRTRLFWWSAGEIAGGPLCMGLAERRRVRGEVLDVLRTLRELTPLFAMVAPLVVCVEGFVADMERVEETLARGVDLLQGVGRTEDFVEELVIALKTVVVGTTGDDIEYHVEEPWCFLGLLGQEVDGAGVRMMWNSSNEAGWKVFWGQFDG
ncbi:hypothetical protein BC830DRAFT_663193 [Chytriomyces sp. MP71]|nr:hypothetical protein BC830DRAFT_663193 [Chytriomyces sp. MP71]